MTPIPKNPDLLGTETATLVSRVLLGGIAAAVLLLVLPLAGCQTAPAARGPEMPQGTGAPQYEPGFSRFCQSHPHESTCP